MERRLKSRCRCWDLMIEHLISSRSYMKETVTQYGPTWLKFMQTHIYSKGPGSADLSSYDSDRLLVENLLIIFCSFRRLQFDQILGDANTWSSKRFSKISNEVIVAQKRTGIGNLRSFSWFNYRGIFIVAILLVAYFQKMFDLIWMVYYTDFPNL